MVTASTTASAIENSATVVQQYYFYLKYVLSIDLKVYCKALNFLTVDIAMFVIT